MPDDSGVSAHVNPESPQPPSGADPQPEHSGRKGGGLFLGVMLVVVGVLFLIPQVVPGFAAPWWALWPLIIVAAGAVQAFTPGEGGWGIDRVLDGLGTVVLGVVLLGNTTGMIAWSVWWALLMLWPALVIALGLTILAKGLGQSWLRIAATLVVWVALAYAVAISWTGPGAALPQPWTSSSGQAFSFAEPNRGIEEANLRLTGGAGDIRIGSGSQLVTVDGSSPFGAPTFSARKSGDTADVSIGFNEVRSGAVIVPGMTAARIDTRLSDTALWNIVLETGASSVDADLSDVQVRSVDVRTGASAVVIKAGDVPADVDSSTIVVKAGASSVRILIPRDAEARFVAQTGLVATDVRGRFERNGNVWETPGYSSADGTWDIRAEAGVGSVSVETY